MARYLGRTKEDAEIFAYDFKEVDVKAVGENEIDLIGSTEAIDRDGEVLKMDGWDLRAFKKNPVVLPGHMYWEPAIGRAKVRIEDKKLKFRIEFPPEGINPVADVYKGLYKGGFMKASSVGFLPLEWEWGDGEKKPRRTFLKQELLEISLVSVPANPQAIVTEKGIQAALEAGKMRDNDVKILEEFIKRCFDESKEKGSGYFYLPNQDGGDDGNQALPDGEDVDGKGQANKDAAKQTSQGDIDPEGFKTRVLEVVKEYEEELISRIVENVRKSIDKDGHYISKILSDQEPKGSTTVSSDNVIKTLTQTISASFKDVTA